MTKAATTELTQRLRDLAKTQDPIAKAVIELIRLHMQAGKDALVSADGDAMLRTQGAVRAFEKLYTDLTKTPPNITETTT
jgi:hypothetical protein